MYGEEPLGVFWAPVTCLWCLSINDGTHSGQLFKYWLTIPGILDPTCFSRQTVWVQSPCFLAWRSLAWPCTDSTEVLTQGIFWSLSTAGKSNSVGWFVARKVYFLLWRKGINCQPPILHCGWRWWTTGTLAVFCLSPVWWLGSDEKNNILKQFDV